MLSFLEQLDQFGVEQKLSVQHNSQTQKSFIGGLATIILYTSSLAYFIYQFIDWQQNNKLPKYTSMRKQIGENETIHSSDIFAEVSQVLQNNFGKVDPFDPQNLILYPYIVQIASDGSDSRMIEPEFEKEIQDDGSYIHKLIIQNVTLIAQPELSRKQKALEFYLIFQICNSSNQTPTLKCAKDEVIQQFIDQYFGFQISIFLDQFDFKTKSLKKIPKTYQIESISDKFQYYDFLMEVNSLVIDDGFLLSNSDQLDYFQQIDVWYKEYDSKYEARYNQTDLVSVMHFAVNQLKEESTVEYPKISEILADSGSIISFIMQLSFFVLKYNEYLSAEKIKAQIIKMYYNDFEQFKVVKNWKGQIIALQRQNESYSQKFVLDFIHKLESMAIQKISFLNLQHEVQQLQILISKVLNLDEIKTALKAENYLSSLLQCENVSQCQNLNKSINQVQPSNEKSKDMEEKEEIGQEILEEDLKKRITCFMINHDNYHEQNNDLLENCSKIEMQVINIESQDAK